MNRPRRKPAGEGTGAPRKPVSREQPPGGLYGALDLAEALLARGVGVEAGLWHAEGARILVDSGLTQRCTRLLIEPLVQDLAGALVLAAEIQESLDDPRASVPHDEVMAAMDAEIDAIELQRAGSARRKGA